MEGAAMQSKLMHMWAMDDGEKSNISLGQFGVGGGHSSPIVVDGRYIVGENVPYFAEPQERVQDWYIAGSGKELMLKAALSQVLEPGEYNLNVVFALPVESIETDPSVSNKVRRWMVGEHDFTVDGACYTVEITSAKGVSQPIAAYFDWGLNDKGEWWRGSKGIKQQTIIFDIGSVTSDLATIENRTVLKRSTRGTVGVVKATRAVQKSLEMQGMGYSLLEVDAIIRNGGIITSNGEDVSDLVDDALDDLANELIGFLRQYVGTGKKAAKMLFVGGGALLLKSQLLNAYPHATIPQDPVFSPARGAKKLGGVGLDLGNGWIKICTHSQSA